jgi:hypothetical protein
MPSRSAGTATPALEPVAGRLVVIVDVGLLGVVLGLVLDVVLVTVDERGVVVLVAVVVSPMLELVENAPRVVVRDVVVIVGVELCRVRVLLPLGLFAHRSLFAAGRGVMGHS